MLRYAEADYTQRMRILFRALEEADEHPNRVELLMEVFAYLCALGVLVISLSVMANRQGPFGDQVILGLTYAVIPLLCWLKIPRYAGRLQFLAVVIAAGFLLPPPKPTAPAELPELEKQGRAMVATIEAFRKEHGRYPESFLEAKITPPRTAWGEWKYRLFPDKHFLLTVGDPADFMVGWDSREGWIVHQKRGSN